MLARETGHEILPDPGLRERHFGVFQGLTCEEMERKHPDLHAQYWSDPGFQIPGGESAFQRYIRVVECVSRITTEHAGRHILAISHGGVLMCLLKHVMGLHFQSPRRFSLFNASVNRFSIRNGEWKLDVWGDTSHLSGIATTDDL
jgi:probable phosphoglycerate mutase